MDNLVQSTHRENPLENYKEQILEKAQSFECSSGDFKKLVAKKSGLTVQYVRKFFREKYLKNDLIEKVAFEELAHLRAEFQLRQINRGTKLAK